MNDKERLEFAYRYPFSSEAKAIVEESKPDPKDTNNLRLAKARIEEALQKGRIDYREIKLMQHESIISYAYARLLVSTVPGATTIEKYAIAEAKRSVQAMGLDTEKNIIRIADELGIALKHEKKLSMDVTTFLKCTSASQEDQLVNYRLVGGRVELTIQEASGLLRDPIAKRVKQGLPISKKEIPKMIIDYSKEIKVPQERITLEKTARDLEWVEKLLANPIPDVRQRVVNLILAPYLVNVKKLEPEEAYKVIVNYIDKCRAIDPTTRITNAQIRYQCNYAKQKGRRPLSLQNAKELLSSVIDVDKL